MIIENTGDDYDAIVDEINERVDEVFPDGMVIFAAYKLDENDLPMDNLDEIAIEGKCILIQKHNPFYGEGMNYESGVIENPTWWIVLQYANQMVAITGDSHHVYLEGVDNTGDEINGIPCYKFQMGS